MYSFIFRALFSAVILFSTLVFSQVRIVPVTPTPEPDNARLTIIYPEDYELEKNHNIKVRVKVTGYALRQDSDFPRNKEIYNSKAGQSIHLVVDDRPYISETVQQVDPFNDEGNFYESIYEFDLPKPLAFGGHTLRAFLARSFNESLKNSKAFDSTIFYYRTKKKINDVNLNKPYLTFNEPSPYINYSSSKPILLDFWVNNCELSSTGYKVKLSIDRKLVKYIESWRPYYIYGLTKGLHLIEMRLVDKKNKPVPGKYSYFKNHIRVN